MDGVRCGSQILDVPIPTHYGGSRRGVQRTGRGRPVPQVHVKGAAEYGSVAETVSSNLEKDNLAAAYLTDSSPTLERESQRSGDTAEHRTTVSPLGTPLKMLETVLFRRAQTSGLGLMVSCVQPSHRHRTPRPGLT